MKKDWTYKKLGECLSYIKNGANIKQTKGASGIPITRIETLSGGVFNRDRLGYADITDSSKYESYYLETGDLLMSHINSKTYIGRTVMYIQENAEKIIHGMNLLKLKVIKEIIEPAYLCYYCKSEKFKNDIVKIRKDAVNQSSICISDLVHFSIPIPPLSIQRSIVAELDLLHSVISKKKEQLRELDNLAQSLFYQMFGDPITNPMGWEVKKLGEVAENCDFMRKPITASDRIPGNIPYYGASGIVDYVRDYIFDGDYLLVSEDGANLLARSTPIAFSISGKNWVNNHAHVLKFQESSTQLYVQTLINLIDISDIVTGAVQPKLNQAQLNKFPLPLPPLSLQQSFAAKVCTIEAQKQAITLSIKETEALLAQRMDTYFS